ncbi:MAG: peptidoglycan DD-metalloendopeptidase family protein [Deltaproteobacteria bacterium]|jgi:murein DD-endopeptidase MepM/ murein hydrolase activator NlpD|nr:peptidoglycan DD-metalloendopeptidase family protein [Deltaproteobacteria bacterium]
MTEGRGPLKIRGFTLPAWAPAAGAACVAVLAAALSIYAFHANRTISGFADRTYELEVLQTENAAKDMQVAALTDRLSALEGQVADLSGRDQDLTLLTRDFNRQLGLPEEGQLADVWPELVNTVAWTWGGQTNQGGVDRKSGPPALPSASSPEALRGLHRDLDRLEEGAAATGFALSELHSALMGSQSLLAVTPYATPVPEGKVSSLFGYRSNPFGRSLDFHAGLDIAAPVGTPVYAPADGTVLSSDWSKSGYGLMVTMDHGYGLSTRYAHLSESLVSPGDRVSRGDLIAKVGSTGRSTGPHLHYETLLGEIQVDPLTFLQAKLEYQTAYLEEKREAREAKEAQELQEAQAALESPPSAGEASPPGRSESAGESAAAPASVGKAETARKIRPARKAGKPRPAKKARGVRGKRTRRG